MPKTLLLLSLLILSAHACAAPAADPDYLIILGQPEEFAKEYPVTSPDRHRQIGFGVVLYTLNTPRDALRKQINDALDKAEATGYPVLIHADDWNYPPTDWTDPAMVEWTAFPAEGQRTGPIVKRRWINWGSWFVTGPPPNYESPRYRAYVRERLEQDIAKPIAERLRRWKADGRAHLFAGLVVGWETGFYAVVGVDKDHPPSAPGVTFTPDEIVHTGYAALTARGWTAAKIAERAKTIGKTERRVMDELLYGVLHDYSDYLCGVCRKAGLPRERIYTHYAAMGTVPNTGEITEDGRLVPMATAMNANSRAGYTMTQPWYDRGVVEQTLVKTGAKAWGAVEVEITEPTRPEEAALAHLEWLTRQGARVICFYGWWEKPESPFAMRSSGAPAAIRRWLAGGVNR